MGRIAGVLAGLVAAARLVADALLIWRDVRRDLEEADPLGAPDVGGSAEAGSPDHPGGVGPPGPDQGPTAGQGAGPVSGPATRG